jgi:hypothetical protein
VEIVIQAPDIAKVASRLAGLSSRAGTAMRGVIQPLGDAYLVELVRETPRGKGPAEGRRRLYQSYQVDEDYGPIASYHIQNRAPWLGFVRRGRPAIVAKPGKMLRFVIGGKVFFRARVGPAKANDFPARVAQTMRPQLERARGDIRSAVLSAYGGG